MSTSTAGIDPLPWRTDAQGVTWPHATGRHGPLTFTAAGIGTLEPTPGAPEEPTYPWAHVTAVQIDLPTTSQLTWFAGQTVSWVQGGEGFAPREATVVVTATDDLSTFTLGRARRYPWRLAFALAETAVHLTASGRLALLGRPGFLDAVAHEVAPALPGRARPFQRTDLFGVERLLGGQGAYGRLVDPVVARFTR